VGLGVLNLFCYYALMLTFKHVRCQTISFANMSFFCYKGIMTDKKMFATRIDPDTLKALKHLAVDTELSIADLTEEAIKDLLKKYKKKAKK